mgnify:CR=1 FL=1
MILAAIVSIPLIIKSFLSGDYVRIISLIIFTISMIGLYGASTAYHSFNISPTINKKLKKLDHAMIFVLIAWFLHTDLYDRSWWHAWIWTFIRNLDHSDLGIRI